MKKIVYIGHKPAKGDNVAGTGLIWIPGQVHEVTDDKKAEKLLEHKLVWADATDKSPEQIAALMLPQVVAVQQAPEPRVSIIPQGPAEVSPYWEPLVIPVPAEVFKGMQDKRLTAVFMTPEDADAYELYKLDRATAPVPEPKKRKAA